MIDIVPSHPDPLLSVHTVDRARQMDPDAWPAHSTDSVFLKHGWLATVEETANQPLQPIYFLACRAGTPVAVAVCYVISPGDQPSAMDRAMFGRYQAWLRTAGLSFTQLLVCGSMMGYGAPIAGERSPEVVALLVDAMEQYASKQQLDLAFFNVLDQDADLIDCLQTDEYLETINFPVSYMNVRWNSFEAYLDSLRAERKTIATKIRREMKAAAKHGIRVARMDTVNRHAEEIHRLVDENYRKYRRGPFPYRADFFSKLAIRLPEATHVNVALRDGELRGAALLMESGGTAWGTVIGSPRDLERNDFSYFNLAYYRPLQDAIAHRWKRIYLGAGLYQLKNRRGCETEPVRIFHRAYSPMRQKMLVPLFRFHQNWYRRKLRNQGVILDAHGELHSS